MRPVALLSALLAAGPGFACEAADASRIAVAGGSITEILYFLREEGRIVATDTTSNFPAEALSFPSVGYVRNLSAEGLLSVGPSLILGESDMGPPEVLAQIEQTGVEAITLSEVHTTEGILEKIRCIAGIVGASDAAEQRIRERLAPTIESLAAVRREHRRKPRVAVMLGLRDGVPLGAGTETSGHGLLEMASAENVFDDFDGWKPVTMEAMIKADPEFIVIPERGVESAGGVDGILGHPAVRLTTAARKRQLIAMDGMSMLGFGPRTLETALELASVLHPSDSAATAPTSGQ